MSTAVAGDAGATLDPALVQALVAEGAVDDHAPGRPIPQVPLAEHRNHTPFPSQCFQTVDQHGEVFHVVALRVTYDMRKLGADGVMACAEEQTPLVTEDHWSGEPNESCPLWESDFAPYKPKCDVLVVNAVSRPPPSAVGKLLGAKGRHRKATRWGCGAALQWKDLDGNDWQWVKHLAVTGPRRFSRSGVTAPEPTETVAIDWQNACGGQLKQPSCDQRTSDGRLTKAAGADRWDTDERNPVGVGLDATLGARAPQLEASIEQPYGGGPAHRYPPVSLTPLGRSWLPRRKLAGTYDNHWLAEQWPLPPLDFDHAYWNCAPADQQIDHPGPGARIHLLNLYPPKEASILDMTNGAWRGRLPDNELFLLWRLHSGVMLDRPLALDTLVVDLATLQIYATYRGLISARAEVRVVEARMAESAARKPTTEPS